MFLDLLRRGLSWISGYLGFDFLLSDALVVVFVVFAVASRGPTSHTFILFDDSIDGSYRVSQGYLAPPCL